MKHLIKSNNLSDVAVPATACSNIGALPAANGTLTGTLDINSSSFTFGTGAAAAFRTAAGIVNGFSGTTNRITVAGTADSNLASTIATSGTNAATNVVSLAVPAEVGSTDVALLLTPKGSGAIIAGSLPDGTATGGNVRGVAAVDLQMSRSAATQVASGTGAFCAGLNNTASATSSIALGSNSAASGVSSSAIGRNNTCSVPYGFALGDSNSVTTSPAGAMAVGNTCTSTGNRSLALGWITSATNTAATSMGYESVADRHAQISHASGKFSVVGDNQWCGFSLSGKTTTNAAAEIGGLIRLVSGKTMSGTINIHGVKSDGGAAAHYIRQFSVSNITRTVASVDTTAETVTFTEAHYLTDDHPIRITSTSTILGGIIEGNIYYSKVVNSTTISVHTATPVGAGNIVNLTSAGAGTRYLNYSRLNYAPVSLGTDLAAGTTLVVSVGMAAGTLDPGANILTPDYLSIQPTGITDEIWRWTMHVSVVETTYGT